MKQLTEAEYTALVARAEIGNAIAKALSGPGAAPLVDTILMASRWKPYTDIHHKGALYMERNWLVEKRKDDDRAGLRVHRIVRSDVDRHLHDHPGWSLATSGAAALDGIRKVLTTFGCSRFGTMTDNEAGELIVQFTYRDRNVTVKASYRGYAAAWLREHPYNASRMRRSLKDHERNALDQAQISVCSILRDWIKGQVTAIEVGILTFEGAFLGQILLPSGKTVLEEAQGSLGLLPAPRGG